MLSLYNFIGSKPHYIFLTMSQIIHTTLLMAKSLFMSHPFPSKFMFLKRIICCYNVFSFYSWSCPALHRKSDVFCSNYIYMCQISFQLQEVLWSFHASFSSSILKPSKLMFLWSRNTSPKFLPDKSMHHSYYRMAVTFCTRPPVEHILGN